MASLICHGLFDRFPNLRIATIETGGMGVPHAARASCAGVPDRRPGLRPDPVEPFREHVWVAPFYEDDVLAR